MTKDSARLEAARGRLYGAGFRLWVMFCIIALLLFANPLGTKLVRLAEIGAVALVWFGLIALVWGRSAFRLAMFGVTVAAVTFCLWPGMFRSNTDELRQSYLSRLRSFEGVRYSWGGENRLGLDCSGLTRRALIDSLLLRGITHAEPATLRAGLALWWNDCSAQTLGEAANGQTVAVTNTKSLNELPADQIAPGDLAVTESGVHVLAHLGGGEWIEADTYPMKVIRVQAPANAMWLDVPMKIVRWRVLVNP